MGDVISTQLRLDYLKDGIVGCVYEHFKGGVYIVTDMAVNTDTEEIMVVYHDINSDMVWCRPFSEFVSEVDHEKYPDVKQALRFKRIK